MLFARHFAKSHQQNSTASSDLESFIGEITNDLKRAEHAFSKASLKPALLHEQTILVKSALLHLTKANGEIEKVLIDGVTEIDSLVESTAARISQLG
jgi:hypothetical protein